jgi:uncharacterized membrane protein
MAPILTSLRNTAIAGLVLLLVFIVLANQVFAVNLGYGEHFITVLFVWAHVISGVMWIGHLYYFNFTQMPSMPKIPDEQKPAISKVIAPAALYWFRHGAMSTIFTGLVVAYLNGYLIEAITLQSGYQVIGIGMWLGTIMWFNVWFIIWPNQQRALGMVDVTPEVKAKSARTAMLFSRTNTMLSIPMLFGMIAYRLTL